MTSPSERRRWPLAVGVVLLVCASPVLALLGHGTSRFSLDLLVHLARTVLPMQLGYAVLASLGAVAAGLLLSLGGLAAGLFEFPGRVVLDRLVLLPLLVPAWFLAVVSSDRWGVQGLAALVGVLGVSCAPLFHLLGTAGLRQLPRRYPEALRMAGLGSWRLAWALFPLLVPVLGAAAALAFLGAWGDAAAARVLAVPTLTVGLLDQWSGREDDAAAALLALVFLLVTALPAVVAWRALAELTGADSGRLAPQPLRLPLRGLRGAVPWLLALPQLVLGVALPALVAGGWALEKLERVNLRDLESDVLRTLGVGVAGTLVALLLALPLLHAQVAAPGRGSVALLGRLTLALFALPPVVLGLAYLWLLPSGEQPGAVAALNATVLPLVLALGTRHAAVFVGAGQAALLRQAPSHTALLRVLGRTDLRSFLGLMRPFLGKPMAAAGAYVFLEVLKDLPLTLVLQPFGFSTMATRLFQYAQSQRIKEAAVWVLCLALVGLFPLFSLARLGGDDATPQS